MSRMLSSREETRERLDAVYCKLRAQYVPADESQPVKNGEFWEWEEMADAFDREMTAAILQELAGLSRQAMLTEPGPCPFCRSTNTKWLDDQGERERRSKHGVVVLPRQMARCRPCGRFFPPKEHRWNLNPRVPLTPQAAERMSREAAVQPFDPAARSLNADWGTSYDGKQIQRWGEPIGGLMGVLQERERLAERLESHLYKSQTRLLIRWLKRQCQAWGHVRESDPQDHPRRVFHENLTYMQRQAGQRDYATYRAKGWPIGSGVTKSGVKLFNKRVKGPEQFWNQEGVESILTLRAMWLSQDDRWHPSWSYGKVLRQAA